MLGNNNDNKGNINKQQQQQQKKKTGLLPRPAPRNSASFGASSEPYLPNLAELRMV